MTDQLTMGKRKIVFILLAALLAVPSYGAYSGNSGSEESASGISAAPSKVTVKGKVIDGTGQPVPGAAILIAGTQTGTMTDINGYYSIEVSGPGVKLEVTSMGYKTQTVTVPKSLELNIFLQDDATELDQAVVVGMGHQRKASVIGAISSVANTELEIPQRNLTNALAGKVAGAVVVQRTGEPGMDNAEFWIRGISSLNSSAPLILVDGVERDMSNLAIEEIETISILKDASATAVYGVRAANGVVLVTTRKGIAQKPQIDVKIEGGISELTNMPKLLDGANYMRLYNEASGKQVFTDEQIAKTEARTDPFMYPNVNWFDELFTRWSNNEQASLSIRGGGERARYYVTAAYIRDNGNLYTSPDTDYSTNIHVKRYNFRSNIDLNITKSTMLSLEIGANMTDSHQPRPITKSNAYQAQASELFKMAYNLDPISTPVRVPIGYDDEGNIKWAWGGSTGNSTNNPAERLFGSGYNKTYQTQIMSQIIVKQNLDMITKGLSANLSFSYDFNIKSIQARGKYSSRYAILGVDDETGLYKVTQTYVGDESLSFAASTTGDRADELKGQINYERNFAGKHRVGAMTMYYQRNFVNLSAGSSIYSLPYRKQGLAFRATYSYDDRYFAEFNAGYNGSENFAKGQRFGFFPAGAIGYLVSNEPWWANIKPYVNHLKLRASMGLVGSDVLATGRFAYLSTWGSGLGGHRFGDTANWLGGVGEDQEGIENLTWEKGLKRDIGLEIKLFNSLLSFDFDYFYEHRWDILIQRNTIPGIAGLNKAPLANMGILDNQGFEFTGELNHHIGPVGYRIYGNFSFARNNVIDSDQVKTDSWRLAKGHPLNQKFGYIALGYFADQDEIDLSPSQFNLPDLAPGDIKYLDYNKDGVVDDHDVVAIGYSNVPEINYGFGAQLTWKGLDLGVFFRGQANVSYSLGGTFFPFHRGVKQGNLFEKALDRWSPDNPNPDAFYPRLTEYPNTNNQKMSTKTIYDGSLIRLSDVEAGYTFKGDWLQKCGCQAFRLYFVGSNLWMHSAWDMWDPETGSSDGSSYPLTRKFNFGVRFTF